jgi:hypothetical protein
MRQAIGCCLLGVGCCLLAIFIGCCLLAVVYWLLAVGCWRARWLRSRLLLCFCCSCVYVRYYALRASPSAWRYALRAHHTHTHCLCCLGLAPLATLTPTGYWLRTRHWLQCLSVGGVCRPWLSSHFHLHPHFSCGSCFFELQSDCFTNTGPPNAPVQRPQTLQRWWGSLPHTSGSISAAQARLD